jgi:hypothetical protein
MLSLLRNVIAEYLIYIAMLIMPKDSTGEIWAAHIDAALETLEKGPL